MYVKSVRGYVLGLVSTRVNAVMMLAMVMMRLRKGFFMVPPVRGMRGFPLMAKKEV